MNWLAHLHLSGDDPATQIGNLLPDMLRPPELRELGKRFQRGIQLHQIIDGFTDSHDIFRRSASRLDAPLRRYAPILVDVFYDHVLANEWRTYSTTSLSKFVGAFHDSTHRFEAFLPERAYSKLCGIRDGGLLLSYKSPRGIEHALRRIASRLSRPVDLAASVTTLEEKYDEFAEDFSEFYPQLIKRVGM